MMPMVDVTKQQLQPDNMAAQQVAAKTSEVEPLLSDNSCDPMALGTYPVPDKLHAG